MITIMNNEVKQMPKILISEEAKEKLDLYIEHCDIEISGLGEIIKQEDGTYLITDLFLFEQSCTGASTSLKSGDIAKFANERINQGLDVSHLNLWWHSHVNMGTFWSSTDEEAINTLDMAFMVSIVGNKKGDYLMRYDLFEPVRIEIDHIPLEVQSSKKEESELSKSIRKEIESKVSGHFQSFGSKSRYRNYAYDEWDDCYPDIYPRLFTDRGFTEAINIDDSKEVKTAAKRPHHDTIKLEDLPKRSKPKFSSIPPWRNR